MAAKAVMRGHRPVCLAIATFAKPNSLEADFARIADTVAEALVGRQLQPMLLQRVAAPWQATAVAQAGDALYTGA
jgi:hypothetical protein